MKQLTLLLAGIISISTASCYGQVSGFIIQEIISADITERVELNYVSDEQPYTTGGVTFTYPVGWFTLPPMIQVSVAPTGPHPSTETYVAEVTTNTAGSTMV